MPYLKYYTEILEEESIFYDVYYWNRHKEKQSKRSNYYEFSHYAPGLTWESYVGYIKYKLFLNKHIKQKSYDFYIVLSTQIAILLFGLLRYHRFILDIRDYSYENIPVYRSIENAILKHAKLVVISSDGFKQWLPSQLKYILSHNISIGAISRSVDSVFDRNSKRILYIGAIRYFRPTVEFINSIANHEGLSLFVVGKGLCENQVEKYCLKRGIKNVAFRGRFLPDEKDKYLSTANFLLAAYGHDSIGVRTLIPNKLYEACKYRKPIIVSKNTYLADIVERYGLGVIFDRLRPQDALRDICSFYESSKYEGYLSNSKAFLETVKRDVYHFKHEVIACLYERTGQRS